MANEELKNAVAKLMEKEIDELEKWLIDKDLPVGVRNIIARGKLETERKIKKYKFLF